MPTRTGGQAGNEVFNGNQLAGYLSNNQRGAPSNPSKELWNSPWRVMKDLLEGYL